jgi:formylglycine-generating enzyme required for sulfatase activity
VLAAFLAAAACSKATPTTDGGLPASSSTLSSWPAPSSSDGTAKPGMVFIPAGRLMAGTPPAKTPRIADEEMPGAAVEMGGFYIDLLPWPNEPNAIPTTAVTRDDAAALCATKQKRLCTELEWERACKGPSNATYEYGDAYRKEPCGTGIPLEQASHRPSGEHAQCKSEFGALEMHGGPWEWTASSWGRGAKDRDAAQGVLRGGNSVAGELVGRCANAIARDPSKKAPTMGFRCCAGTKNTEEVQLERVGTPELKMTSSSAAEPFLPALATVVGAPSVDPKTMHAWSWIPLSNEELVIALGCSEGTAYARKCGLVIGRHGGGVLAQTDTGRDPPEVNRANGNEVVHLRLRSLDAKGVFSRDITYLYGKVELGDPKRP